MELGKVSSETFTYKGLTSESSLREFEDILKSRSEEISRIEDYEKRKEASIVLVSSVDAFFCYLDIFYRGNNENAQINMSSILNDARYKELFGVFSRAGGEAMDMIGEVETGSELYKKGVKDAGRPAKKYSNQYLSKNKITDTEYNWPNTPVKKAKDLIDRYLSNPQTLDLKTRIGLSVKLRLANHTWKIDQIERKSDGEKNRIRREIYRVFDGIKFLKEKSELIDELYKDWVHVT